MSDIQADYAFATEAARKVLYDVDGYALCPQCKEILIGIYIDVRVADTVSLTDEKTLIPNGMGGLEEVVLMSVQCPDCGWFCDGSTEREEPLE